MSLSGINGIQPLFTAMAAAFALGLRVASEMPGPSRGLARRVLEVTASAVAPAAAAWALVPGLREGTGQGLLALTAGNAWYASIREFQPLLFSGAGIAMSSRPGSRVWLLSRHAPGGLPPPQAGSAPK